MSDKTVHIRDELMEFNSIIESELLNASVKEVEFMGRRFLWIGNDETGAIVEEYYFSKGLMAVAICAPDGNIYSHYKIIGKRNHLYFIGDYKARIFKKNWENYSFKDWFEQLVVGTHIGRDRLRDMLRKKLNEENPKGHLTYTNALTILFKKDEDQENDSNKK